MTKSARIAVGVVCAAMGAFFSGGAVGAASFTWGEQNEILNEENVVIDYVVEKVTCRKMSAISAAPNGYVRCIFLGKGGSGYKYVDFKNGTGGAINDAMLDYTYDSVMSTLELSGLTEGDNTESSSRPTDGNLKLYSVTCQDADEYNPVGRIHYYWWEDLSQGSLTDLASAGRIDTDELESGETCRDLGMVNGAVVRYDGLSLANRRMLNGKLEDGVSNSTIPVKPTKPTSPTDSEPSDDDSIPSYCDESFIGPLLPEQREECDRLKNEGAGNGECATILTGISCEGDEGKGIAQLLMLALRILTAGVGILATIGLVVSGIQYVTARDDTSVVTKVKSRIFNIVIGLVAYGLMWIILEWLIPGGILD